MNARIKELLGQLLLNKLLVRLERKPDGKPQRSVIGLVGVVSEDRGGDALVHGEHQVGHHFLTVCQPTPASLPESRVAVASLPDRQG